MARQSSGRRNTEDTDGAGAASAGPGGAVPAGGSGAGDEDLAGGDLSEDYPSDDAGPDGVGSTGRDAETTALWARSRIDPIEIALPRGTGYTLRAYRPAGELTPTAAEADEDDPFARLGPPRPVDEDEVVILDEEFAELVAEESEEPGAGRGRQRRAAGEVDEQDEPEDIEEQDEADEADTEEVPVFLSHRGKLLLFRTPESLVEFVRSGAEHDLAQLDTWTDVAARLRPEDVVPLEEDTYELDLVVDNLRGGHDTWDADLLIEAGEIARDLAYALRLEAIQTALAPGSPLDDLDEALRANAGGGLGGFLARRRLRKIGAQQATLGWRTIIGKISGAVVWRE
ncbi:MAG TPA: DNA primase [Micromonosporaceae bacterium]|nr:DNA primase [Micromonosporaceae bacterium]